MLFLPLLVGLRGLGQYLGAVFMASTGERTVNDLRGDVLQKLQSLSLDYFNRTSMGDLLQRINGDTASLSQCLSTGFMDSVKEPFSMIGITIALLPDRLETDARGLGPDAAVFDPDLDPGQESANGGGDRNPGDDRQASLLAEMLPGIRVVKALDLEDEQAATLPHGSRRS